MHTVAQCTQKRSRSAERGVALIAALFALMLLSAIGLGMMYAANMETDINSNYRDSVRAHYGARAGLEEVRERLRTGAVLSGTTTNIQITPPSVVPSTTGGVLYILNSNGSSVRPWSSGNAFFDTELCHEGFYDSVINAGIGAACPATSDSIPSGNIWYTTTNSVAPGVGTSSALDYRWVRITLKTNGSAAPYYANGSSSSSTLKTRMCWDPATRHQILLPTGAANCDVEGYRHIYLITSLAITPTGARRMLQSEVTQFGLPPLPAALTLPGPSPTYGSPNSSNFHIEGEDHADPDCSNVTGDPTPGIAITDATSEDDVQDAIPDNREANYTGSEGTTPDIQPLSQASMPGLYTVAELKALTELVEANANRTYYQSNPGTPVTPTLGTLSSPQVVYVEGDAVVSGSGSYSGVLFVTGTLTMDGGARFDGIIFVVGEGVLEFSGGGGGQINGGIFVAKILDNSNPPNYLSELGSPTLDWSGGGNNGIEYSTCAIKKATGGTAFTVLSSKELSY